MSEYIKVKFNGWESAGYGIIIPAGRTLRFTVPATGEKVGIDDIVYCILPEGTRSYRVQIVTKINDQDFVDFMHWNVRETGNSFNLTGEDGKRYTIISKDFCQPLDNDELDAIIDDPKKIVFLNSQIETSNPSSPLNSNIKNYISITSKEKGLTCTSCNSIMKKNVGNLSLLTRICPSCIASHPDVFTSELSKIKALDYKYYVKKYNEPSYSGFKTKRYTKASSYYNVIDATNIEEEISSIPKIEKDLICLGLGSAGSGILDQLMKTNMVEDFILIDFDKIEKKNTRNQIYSFNHIGSYKTSAMQGTLANMRKKSIAYNSRFQDVNLSMIKCKYIVLGFDTIQTRLEAFEKIKTREIEAEYIIDTRYLDLECSIYFVNTTIEAEMNYYERLLLNDLEYFNKQLELRVAEEKAKPIKPYTKCTVDNLVKWWNSRDYFHSRCAFATREITGSENQWCNNPANENRDRCMRDVCHAKCRTLRNNNMISLCNYINTNKVNVAGLTDFTNCPKEEIIEEIFLPFEGNSSGEPFDESSYNTEENTCLKMNIIDIYKFASSFITSAMREIFEEREKPFTHVECQTNVFPSFMKVR